MENIKLFKVTDIFVIIAAVVTSIIFAVAWFSGQKDAGRLAVIEVDGEVYQTIDMDSLEHEIRVQTEGDISVAVVVSQDCAYIEKSGCKDKICVNTGKLSKAGQISVCLPAKVSLSIIQDKGNSSDLPDAVTG